MENRFHALSSIQAPSAIARHDSLKVASNSPGASRKVSVVAVLALALCLGAGAKAQNHGEQGNDNQHNLLQRDITAHSWHTGDPKNFVFEGNPATMEHPGGDPDFLVDGDRIYVYTSTDANQQTYGPLSNTEKKDGRYPDTYLDMDGYTVWSSEDMIHWTNHGVQFAAANMDSVQWAAVKSEADALGLYMGTDTTLNLEESPHAMWAPTVAKYADNGNTTYVLYYPKGLDGVSRFATGYATSTSPVGPFTDRGPLFGDIDGSRHVIAMDPNVFQDDDKKVYIYGNGSADKDAPGEAVYAELSAFDHVAKSQSLVTKPEKLEYDMNNTMFRGAVGNRSQDTDFHEGGSMHKSNGKYYFSWAEDNHSHYNGFYSMCETATGPCEWIGPTVKGTYYGNQHGSFAKFKGKEYFFTHNDHDTPVKDRYQWDSYRRTWTYYPVVYNADKSIRVSYPDKTEVVGFDADINVNIGGVYDSVDGTSYLASTYVAATNPAAVELSLVQAANPGQADLELYKDQGYVWNAPLTVSAPVENGDYNVTLKFAELYAPGAAKGSRVMDVVAEDILIESGLDVFDKAGGVYRTHDVSFSVAVTDGTMSISINPVNGSNPILNALQIVKADKPEQVEWNLNLGGVVTVANGLTYEADPGVGYGKDSTTEAIDLNANEVINATEDDIELFKTTRIGFEGLSYNRALPNGNYEVTLGFVETYHNDKALRVFDVAIEGIVVLDDFDVYRTAGGRNRALKRVFSITLDDGRLNIDLTTETDASKISFFKVKRLADNALDSSIRIDTGHNLNGTDTAGAFFLADYQYLVGSNSTGGVSNRTTTRKDRTFDPDGQKTSVKKDKQEVVDGVPQDVYVDVMPTRSIEVVPSDEVIYKTERYGGNFGYEIPVRDGKYRVRLMFAEHYHNAAGMRKFEISIEGAVQPLDRDGNTEMDIYALTGGRNKAIDYYFEIDVTDGKLNIDFDAKVDNASVAGIVITPAYLKENHRNADANKWEPASYRDDQL